MSSFLQPHGLCGLPGSSIHRILQARILKWIAFPFPGNLPNTGTEPMSPTLQADSLLSKPPGKPFSLVADLQFYCVSLSFYCVSLSCPREKAMAPHSSTLAWRIPWTEGPGGLQSMGSLGVRHGWATSFSLFTFMHWRRKWQPTPVFLPGESQGQGSLVGCCLWGRTESDTTEPT